MSGWNDCPFCAQLGHGDTHSLVAELADAFPVNPGHRLVMPRRHVASYLEATREEKSALWAGVDTAIAAISAELAPDGFNVGINIGPAAGQTVGHVHIHVIPRFTGDMDDPRGGIRHVIPSKARYW